MTSESVVKKEKSGASPNEPKARPAFAQRVWLLLIHLLELLLPVVLSFAAFGYLFASFNLWQYERTLIVVLFGVAVCAVALLLSVFFDRFLEGVRRGYYKKGLKLGKGANSRMIKMALGGLLIPIAVVLASNLAPLPASLGVKAANAMDYLAAVSARAVVTAPPDAVGQLAQQSENVGTKILSIQVLQGFKSAEGLSQLMHIAAKDSMAIQDGGTRAALQKAIATYGADAKEPLLLLFKSIPADANQAGASSADLYTRYFGQSFEGLKQEINLSTTDEAEKQQRLAQLEASQAKLQQDLAVLEDTPAAGGNAQLDFVMQTLLALNLKKDDSLLAFAKATAADPQYSALVRGDALLLAAQLGSQTELDWLYAYVNSQDALLQTRALQAIVKLQEKLAAGK
jgi:hypothetical protein